MKRSTAIFFVIIIFIAAMLRLIGLADIPPGVNRDEASIGYTAYSIIHTGNDEYGRKLPLSFESFGDWKLPLYIYTAVPFVATLGVNEWAVRLPSALAGILSVAVLFFLVRELFASDLMALLSAGVLAVMPWHIHISRVESESNIAILFVICGTLLFLHAVKYKSLTRLTLAALLFGATYFTYHGNHIFTTLYLAGLFALYGVQMTKIPKWWIAMAAGAAAVAVILSVTLFGADRTKISGISIFGDPTTVHTKIELPRLDYANPNGLVPKLIHNRVTFAVTTVISNYLTSYGPEFLFIRGGGNRAHNIRGYGNLHPIEAPLLLIGLVWLIINCRKKEARLILWWMAIGAAAASITKDAPHSNRMFAVAPSFAMAAAAGILYLRELAGDKGKTIAMMLVGAGYIFFMALYLNQYIVHFPRNEAASWGSAYRELSSVLMSPDNREKQVIMTHPETSPYIYLLFYSGYDPASYQREAKRYPISRDGFTDVAGFGRFSFRPIDWAADPGRKNTLMVVSPEETPLALTSRIVSRIMLPDGTTAWNVLAN
jgi:4-amino-4-deoxy-L-arabinose transferase-like glycosyltransferase